MARLTRAQVRKAYLAERERFAEFVPDVLGIELVFESRHYLDEVPAKSRNGGRTSRDLAWLELDDGHIHLFVGALDRSMGHIIGVLRHELGHAIDERIDEPGCERRADRLAALVTGSPIRYTREGLQHATHGIPRRPGWLHQ